MELPQTLETIEGRPLKIELARAEGVQEIFNFLLDHFIPVPPIRQLSQYDDGLEEHRKPLWVRDYVQKCIDQPYSLLIRNESDGQLVAVMLNILEEKSSYHSEPPVHNLTTTYLTELYKDVDLFAQLETDRIFHLAIVAVASEYAHHGLATKLYELSINLFAGPSRAGAIKTEAGSAYVARVATKLGLAVYKSLDFASIEYEGSYPLAKDSEGMGEHKTARLMARRLP